MALKKYQCWLLAIFSGILLAFPWFDFGNGLFLCFALIPLLFVERYFSSQPYKKNVQVFFYSYFSFFIWNLLATWWIKNASLFGAVAAIIINPIFYAVVFLIFHLTKKIIGHRLGLIAFVIYWITFEYIHLNWELSWPWLTLGNGFANNVKLIQWYEFTGVLGGSLWILCINVLVFQSILLFINREKLNFIIHIVVVCFILFIPIIISLNRYYSYTEKNNPCNIVVVQPNIDPYNEKFGGMPAIEQFQILLNLSLEGTKLNTDYIVAPETAIDFPNIWEKYDTISKKILLTCTHYIDDTAMEPRIKYLTMLIDKFPNIKIISGISSSRAFLPTEKISPTARTIKGREAFRYDSYNTAIQLDSSSNIQLYHKSKLVLGVEKMPFPKTLGILEKLTINLGGTTGSLGTQEHPSIFSSPDNKFRIAPLICYESVYGEFVTRFVKKGANLIFVITNDGWWGNTPGHRQHLSYSRIRAIETRRSIARSANTGISCFINQRGDLIEPTEYWTRTQISNTINANTHLTYYVKHGDYIGRIAIFITILLCFMVIIKIVFNKK